MDYDKIKDDLKEEIKDELREELDDKFLTIDEADKLYASKKNYTELYGILEAIRKNTSETQESVIHFRKDLNGMGDKISKHLIVENDFRRDLDELSKYAKMTVLGRIGYKFRKNVIKNNEPLANFLRALFFIILAEIIITMFGAQFNINDIFIKYGIYILIGNVVASTIYSKYKGGDNK